MQSFLLRALRWLNERPWQQRPHGTEIPLGAFAADALERLYRKSMKDAHHIDRADAARRHRLRIRMKRLRYACDFFEACFPGAAARPYIKRLAALQDILGELNDIAVARRLLDEIATGVAAAAHVRRTLAARERMLVIALGAAWATFEKRRPFWRPPA